MLVIIDRRKVAKLGEHIDHVFNGSGLVEVVESLVNFMDMNGVVERLQGFFIITLAIQHDTKRLILI